MSRAEALRLADSLQDLLVLGGVHTDPVGQQSVETLRRWPENEADIASLYEELRRATDGGSESMTHADAVQAVRDQDKRIAALAEDSAIQREAFHMMRDRADYLEAALADRDKVIEQARVGLEAILRHFTKVPSTLADSKAWGGVHDGLQIEGIQR